MATVTAFRLMLPEFSDSVKYTDPLVQMWMNVATKLVNAERWGDLTEFGVNLLTAHYVVLAVRTHEQAAGGKTPGQVTGVLTSKSADGLSASYDVSSMTIKDAGDYNLTTYGIRFAKLARMMGAGPLHVGTGEASLGVSSAWPGVIYPY